MQWADGKIRCHWVNPANTTYLRYHDDEWGRPVHNDHMLFEMLRSISKTLMKTVGFSMTLQKKLSKKWMVQT